MTKKVAIIGGGPSGIAATRQALHYGFEPTVFEKSAHYGGLWRYDPDPETRSIPRGTTTQHSKEFCAFSDFPLPEHFTSDFLHNSQVLEYLYSYARKFEFERFLSVDSEVTQIRRASRWSESGKWIVEYRKNSAETSEEAEFDAVLICTGFYSKPYRPPDYRLERQFSGRIIHSAAYRTPADYSGKTIVVVGFGNSAISLACELAPIAKQVYLSSRRGAWLLSKLARGGAPWDLSFNSQFSALARRFASKFAQNLLWEREARKICNHQRAGILPKQNFLSAHLTFADALPLHLANGRIRMASGLLSFTSDGRGVEFADKSIAQNVDEVIFCTGFTFDFPFLENGELIRVIYNDFHLYKQMFLPELAPHNNLALIGHLQPTGALFPIVEMQARFFFHALSGKAQIPSPFKMKSKLERKRCNMSLNFVKTQRYTQIEDYVDYMNELAADIGCRPHFGRLLLKDPKLALACLFGPTTAHQYRLEGPNVWPKARAKILEQYPIFHSTKYSAIKIFTFLSALFLAFALRVYGIL